MGRKSKTSTSSKQKSSPRKNSRRSRRLNKRLPSPSPSELVSSDNENDTSINPCDAAHSPSPTWDCEEGDTIPEEDPESGGSDNGTGGITDDDSGSSDEDQVDAQQSRNARAPNWKPWQDRYLVQMVDKLRPFEAGRHETSKAWDNLSIALKAESSKKGPKSTVDRTGTACRSRFLLLVKFHEQEQTRSKQKTGTNEEVDEHVRLMDDLVEQVRESKLEGKNKTQKKDDTEKQAGLEIRDAAMKSLVPRENLTDIAGEDAPIRERQGQRKRRRSSSVVSDKENESSPKKRHRNKIDEVIKRRNKDDEKRLEEARECEEKRHKESIEVQTQMVGVLQNLNTSINEMRQESRESHLKDTEAQGQQSQILASLATIVAAASKKE
ncbi:hypothetical protein K435DRAFT_812937 [Dendrothele bispora CBS 962.96]|uniref:Myb-like domain-containing protein n=1 Tax=Dendrothele bispora (strain CBS 962.96) TaxID=1314807 RepID=A0A4S8KMY8_DENBC|nr:hypothetical protein K435DRAFT_812937 [Dendrothele bispora CBS 962.96]